MRGRTSVGPFTTMKLKNLLQTALVCGAIFASLSVSSARAEDAAEASVRPVPLKTPPPVYPAQLKDAGVSGVVVVKVLVDETGSVVECAVTKSSRSEFEEPATAAVKTWKFRPANKGGEAVKSRIVIPINFTAEA
jgi:periplasmic protein TonB